MKKKIEEINPEHVKRRRYLIEMDLETAPDVYSRLSSQRTLIRGWAITLLLGYLGFLINRFYNGTVLPNNIVLPALIIISVFCFLDAFVGRDMWLLRKNVREIEQIFMTPDDEEFTNEILKYEPREIKRKEKGIRGSLLDLYSSLPHQERMILFYLLLAFASFVMLHIFKLQYNPFYLILVSLCFLFFVVGIIDKMYIILK